MNIHPSDLINGVTAEQHAPAKYLIELAGDVMEALECGDTEAARLVHRGPARGLKDLTLEELNDYRTLAWRINPFTNVTVDVSDPGDTDYVAAFLTAAPGLRDAEPDFDSTPNYGQVLTSVRTEHTRTYPDCRMRALTNTERCWQAKRIVEHALEALPSPEASIDGTAIGE